MKTNKKPSFKSEKTLWKENLTVFGIDEVGRGSFAGPLVGAAVCFNKTLKQNWLSEINDSKVLSSSKRFYLSRKIISSSTYFIEEIDLETINKIGIGKSNSLLFKRLIKRVIKKYKNTYFIIDGRKNIKNKNTQFIIRGDSKSISIAAASIVAKVYRDRIMKKLHKDFPNYGFSKNKGYGTKFHRNALKEYGISEYHRTSFDLQKFLS